MKKIAIAPEKGFKVIAGTSRSQVATMVLAAKESTGGPDNKHETSDQWLYVISGEGRAIVEGKENALSEGTLLLIEAGETHEIINNGDQPMKTLNFYCPPEY